MREGEEGQRWYDGTMGGVKGQGIERERTWEGDTE